MNTKAHLCAWKRNAHPSMLVVKTKNSNYETN
jgi:hypothetical protein